MNHKFVDTLEKDEQGKPILQCIRCNIRAKLYSNGCRGYLDVNGKVYSGGLVPKCSTSGPIIVEKKDKETLPDLMAYKTELKLDMPIMTDIVSTIADTVADVVDRQVAVPTEYLMLSPLAEKVQKNLVQQIKLVPQSGLNQEEALLKDALTVIHVIYAEMVRNNLHTDGMRIARNLLISQSYIETVKKIESKLT